MGEALNKLDRLKEWGEEPADYAERLRPILQRFVDTWDSPDSEENKDFWKNMVRSQRLFSCGGPPDYRISGWITGFLHWSRMPRDVEKELQLVLDGVAYFLETLKDVPVGYAKAPLKMMDYPNPGANVGVQRLAVTLRDGPGEGWKVTAQPMSAWFLYGPVDETVKTGPGYGNGDELLRMAAGLGMCETHSNATEGDGDVGIGGDGSGTSWW